MVHPSPDPTNVCLFWEVSPTTQGPQFRVQEASLRPRVFVLTVRGIEERKKNLQYCMEKNRKLNASVRAPLMARVRVGVGPSILGLVYGEGNGALGGPEKPGRATPKEEGRPDGPKEKAPRLRPEVSHGGLQARRDWSECVPSQAETPLRLSRDTKTGVGNLAFVLTRMTKQNQAKPHRIE